MSTWLKTCVYVSDSVANSILFDVLQRMRKYDCSHLARSTVSHENAPGIACHNHFS